MPSTQKLSLDDAEATLVKLHPLLLLNYSQFVIIGSVPFVLMLASTFLVGYVNGFGAFVLMLLGYLVFFAVAAAFVRFGIPLAMPWLRARVQGNSRAAGSAKRPWCRSPTFRPSGASRAWLRMSVPIAGVSRPS